MGAAAAEIPRALVEQLREGGRLVLPVGPSTAFHRYLQVDKLPGGEVTVKDLGTVRFTPLIGTCETCRVRSADTCHEQIRTRSDKISREGRKQK